MFIFSHHRRSHISPASLFPCGRSLFSSARELLLFSVVHVLVFLTELFLDFLFKKGEVHFINANVVRIKHIAKEIINLVFL